MSSSCQCSVYIAASLDGFIARASGALDWLSMVERAGEDYGFSAFFETVDTMVMGRKTYETALGFDTWPYSGKRCIVLTTSTHRVARHGEEFFSGELPLLVERLGAEGATRAYVDGGATIACALRAAVVDELTVSIIPVLLGEGVPLSPQIGHDVLLDLISHRAFESGLVQLKYRPRAR